MNRTLIVSLALAAGLCAHAITDTMTGMFNSGVRTLRVEHSSGDMFAPAVVVPGAGDRLYISFDHLADDREYLRWRAVRCDANWQPSSLAESEWLDSFNESAIETYDYSRATTVPYVHYEFKFPNDDITPAMSGNYLIQVYPENDPEDVWLQTRVMISEQSAPVVASLTSRTDVDYNREHQQLTVEVDTERAGVDDPFNDLRVVISQNGRCDNEIMVRQPLRMSGRKAVYEHQQPLIFEAGNEYRRMEVSNINYPGMGVEDIGWHAPYYHFTLQTDESRAGHAYLYDQTQNGRFVVREYNSDQSDVDADYVVVHFSLDYPELPGWMIFLDGDFTQRRFDDASRMFYNHETGRYEKALQLKQGAYNYQYLAVRPGGQRGETSVIEGDKYQTQNEYLIKVYARGTLDRTDRLIGVTRLFGAN
ncbi:MAG: DUF5103 domain-containing protein [Muribaculaceae bacterium]|nr:DUF5103 domain-containing protein [Muribaculaceae bacterium]